MTKYDCPRAVRTGKKTVGDTALLEQLQASAKHFDLMRPYTRIIGSGIQSDSIWNLSSKQIVGR